MELLGKTVSGGIRGFKLHTGEKSDRGSVIALAGNPNVGKSTVFNSLTGLNQHTGNWPGKTVTTAEGRYRYKDKNYILVDLPGTYSLMANSAEEEIARDFICSGEAEAVVVVADATCLERNLNLVLQTMEITAKVVLCVNLIDEAEKKKIRVDLDLLAARLGIPVVGTNARNGKGLTALKEAVRALVAGSLNDKPLRLTYHDEIEKVVALVGSKVKEWFVGPANSRWIALRLLEDHENLTFPLEIVPGCTRMQTGIIQQKVMEAKKQLQEAGMGPEQIRDQIVTKIFKTCETICQEVIRYDNKRYAEWDRRVDRIITSRLTGVPIMILILSIVFWITISGANYPSELIARGLFRVEAQLAHLFKTFSAPPWLLGLLVEGVFKTLAWVVSVMLPPMAIFFPLFTLLEDSGLLPRIAFNLDNFFRKACAHGKQALTMCMGFGCNAAGIIGCRIIDSSRERLIATITNNFVPCNGRFPILIAIITMFFAGRAGRAFQSLLSTFLLTGIIVLGVVATVLISKLLSRTILKGLPSSFNLELPPYRRPQIGRVLVRSIFDRTLFVLGRAVIVAAPAGLVIWILSNTAVGNLSLLAHCARFLDPFSKLLGMDGFIMMAFILGFPANEIVIPIIIMSYLSMGTLIDLENLSELHRLFVNNGWSWLTAVCVMMFSLMHWPCGTTCLTIYQETRSLKWTFFSFAVPTVTGIIVCLVIANAVRLLGLAP